MKFEYGIDVDRSDTVAFIDDAGDLCIAVESGIVYLLRDGSSFHDDDADLMEYMNDNGFKRKFYPGDKITITF